ncbi:hypothetical protein LINPERPRIM_LOCUS27456 [Linum perenne]
MNCSKVLEESKELHVNWTALLILPQSWDTLMRGYLRVLTLCRARGHSLHRGTQLVMVNYILLMTKKQWCVLVPKLIYLLN